MQAYAVSGISPPATRLLSRTAAGQKVLHKVLRCRASLYGTDFLNQPERIWAVNNHAAILSALKERLGTIENDNGEKFLKSILIPASPLSAETIFDRYPDLTHFPAALIVPDKMLPDNGGLTRTLAVHIFLLAESFCNGGAAPEILKLQEKVLDLVSPDAKGYLPVIGGAHIRLSGSATEAFADLYSCWKVTLNACYA